MQRIALVAAVSVLCALSAARLSAQTVSTNPLTLSDGAVATAYDHCGDSDLCAKILYPSGDELLFYSEGAALGQPYYVHVVRTHGKLPFFQYSRRLENRGSALTLDRGRVLLSVDLNRDGTLKFGFAPVR